MLMRSLSKHLTRAGNQLVHPIPYSIHDVNIDGQWKRTIGVKRFLLRLDNQWGIAVFASRTAITALVESDTWFIDATFKSVPAPYSQFFVIHGL